MATGLRQVLRQGQQLVLTQQLQQAIKLLQLSSLDLVSFVEQQVESNPLLEFDYAPGENAPQPAGTETSAAAPGPSRARPAWTLGLHRSAMEPRLSTTSVPR